jgi:hypothetical protein
MTIFKTDDVQAKKCTGETNKTFCSDNTCPIAEYITELMWVII